jgi:hypothetical protein
VPWRQGDRRDPALSTLQRACGIAQIRSRDAFCFSVPAEPGGSVVDSRGSARVASVARASRGLPMPVGARRRIRSVSPCCIRIGAGFPIGFVRSRYMSYVPTLLASLDVRLDELASEISTLEGGRAALRTPTPAAPPMSIADNGAAPKRPRRPTPRTKTPAPEPTAPAADSNPELAAAAANGASSEAPKPRRRAP